MEEAHPQDSRSNTKSPSPPTAPKSPTPEYLAEDESSGVFSVAIVCTALAVAAIILRFISRYLAKAKLWWDDYTIVVAMGFEASLTAFIIYSERHLLLGRHIILLGPDKAVAFAKNMLIVQELYFAAQSMIKISLLFLYYRIFGVDRRFRIASWVAGVIVIAWWISCIFPTIFACIPVNAFWNPTITDKRCINQRAFGTANGAFNMVTDLMVLMLPLPMVWSLKFNLRKKLLVSGAFLVGTFVCIISIIRLSEFPGFNLSDPSFGAAKLYLWTNVESCCAVIAACLPTLGPLFIGFIGAQVSRLGTSKYHSSRDRTTDSEHTIGHHPQVSLGKGGTTSAPTQASGKFYRLDNNDDGIPLAAPSPVAASAADRDPGRDRERNNRGWRTRGPPPDSQMSTTVQGGPAGREEYPMGVLKQTTFHREDSRF